MHRLFAETAALLSPAPALPPESAAHLKVIRPKEGEEIELFDGAGLTRRCVYSAGALRPSGDVVSRPRRFEGGVTLFACVTKGARWDWTIEKATELGVTKIVPVISKRTIVRLDGAADRAAKLERWRKIALEAVRQSDAAYLPQIPAVLDFGDALAEARRTTCFAGAIMDEPPPPLLAALEREAERDAGGEWSFFVGPEGDFTPEELAALLEFAVPTSLGPAILRAETAAILGVGLMAAVRERKISPASAPASQPR